MHRTGYDGMTTPVRAGAIKSKRAHLCRWVVYSLTEYFTCVSQNLLQSAHPEQPQDAKWFPLRVKGKIVRLFLWLSILRAYWNYLETFFKIPMPSSGWCGSVD